MKRVGVIRFVSVACMVQLVGMLFAARAAAAEGGATGSPLDAFNYVVGTQTIGSRYQFTSQPRLVETAQAILEMGSNTLKFAMGPAYATGHRNVTEKNAAVHSLKDLAALEPAHKLVLDMPFAYYHIWSYTFAGDWWYKGLSKEAADREYREMYDFAQYLLQTYSGTGKTFLLGHWEGDWHLRPGYNPKAEIPPVAIQGMIDWLNVRQRAVDDARRDTPRAGVAVYHYTEVNLVQIGLQGEHCLSNDVLPRTNVDFVSYSSYDSLQGDIRGNLLKALDHIESKLPPKPGVGIGGKRVFIGEYGFPAIPHGAQRQEELSRQVMRAALEWGCPFVLYWEMYCNEIADGQHRGFWMIDNQGRKQPVYQMHAKYYQEARRYVAEFEKAKARLPTAAEFRKVGLDLLEQAATP